MIRVRKSIESFVPLSEDHWLFIKNRIKETKLKRGSLWAEAGEVCNRLAFIKRGAMRFYYLHEGKEHLITFALENEFLTAMASFVSREPSRGIVDALEDCELFYFEYEDMQAMYKEVPALEKFGRLAAEHLYVQVNGRVESLLLLKPEERLLRMTKRRPDWLERIPQYQLASYLGITPESLSRIRSKLFKPIKKP